MKRAAAGLRQLDQAYSETGDAEILIIYQKEPHTAQMAFEGIAQPETIEERIALAAKMKTDFELTMPVLVDRMDDASRALLSDLPAPVFVIDSEGVIQAKLPWPDLRLIKDAVNQVNTTGTWRVPASETVSVKPT